MNGATLTSDRFGNAGKAYSFDGNSDITVLHNSIFNLQTNNSITISLWFKTDTNQVSRTPFVQKHSGGGASQVGFDAALDNNGSTTNTLYTSLSVRNGIGSHWGYSYDSSEVFTDNSWYNVLFVYEQNIGKCYINGTLRNTITNQTGVIGNNTNSLLFGSTNVPSSFSKKYIGELDDIGIWNRALTQQEITDLYNANICYQLVTVTDTLLINTGSITGFNPLSYENTIKIWPNPSNSQITIDAGDLNVMNGYSIRIVNALGQQMFQTALTQQQYVVNLSGWTGPGLYYVNIINPQGVTIDTKKIVIQ